MRQTVKTTHIFLCIFLMTNESTDLEPQPFKHSTMVRKILKCLANFPMMVLSNGSGDSNQSINHRTQSYNGLIVTIQQGQRIMLLNFFFTQCLKWDGVKSITVIEMKIHQRLDIR